MPPRAKATTPTAEGKDAGTEEASLGERAYQVLRRSLRDGLIRADRQYSESEFADMLGISRTPVREALKALEREGVLEASRHRGYHLRTFTDAEVEEVDVLRRALERIAVTKFVERGSEADLEVLADVLRRQKEDVEGREIFALDEEFHLTIAELAGLRRTRDMLLGLRSAVAAVAAGASVPVTETRHRVDEHYAIYEAIAARDAKKASRLMDQHIKRALRAFLDAPQNKLMIEPLRQPGERPSQKKG